MVVFFSTLQSNAQGLIVDPNFQEFHESWKTINTVDYSTMEAPAWWSSYDHFFGPDSMPVVGISFSRRNPEFIYTKLKPRPGAGDLFTVSIVFKPLGISGTMPQYMPFTCVNRPFFKPSNTEVDGLYLLQLDNATKTGDWYHAEGTFHGNGKQWFVLGAFLQLANYGNQETKDAMLLVSEIKIVRK